MPQVISTFSFSIEEQYLESTSDLQVLVYLCALLKRDLQLIVVVVVVKVVVVIEVVAVLVVIVVEV